MMMVNAELRDWDKLEGAVWRKVLSCEEAAQVLAEYREFCEAAGKPASLGFAGKGNIALRRDEK